RSRQKPPPPRRGPRRHSLRATPPLTCPTSLRAALSTDGNSRKQLLNFSPPLAMHSASIVPWAGAEPMAGDTMPSAPESSFTGSYYADDMPWRPTSHLGGESNRSTRHLPPSFIIGIRSEAML